MVEDREERFTGIAGARVELDRAECERIERVLCEELKLRKDFQEEELQRRIARAVTSIAGAKSALKWIKPRRPAFREIGRKQTDEELHGKLAPKMKALINTIDSLHKPALDALNHAGSQLGVVRSMLEAELKIVHAADLSTVPTPTGCPKGSLFAQPQRGLTLTLAKIYLDLTGEYPTGAKKRYGFRAFADAMFAAMQTKPPSRYIVEAACKFVPKK
jgi:hypothetical protein